MNRVISYIDGFNLYFGLRSKGWRKFYWLDLAALTQSLLKDYQQFEYCHYFTARIKNTAKTDSFRRQTILLNALETRAKLTCHFGHYLQKTRQCKNCEASWVSYEEKMTDVNIATQMLVDAYENKFDTAILISGDSDLKMPILKIKELFPDKKLIVAFPPGRKSCVLRNSAHGYLTIGEDKLRRSLLPDKITLKNGYVIERPQKWY